MASPSSRGAGDDNFLELLAVDWTFGTEELASYSRFIQQVEKNPSIFMQAQDASLIGFQDKDKVKIFLEAAEIEAELTVVQNMAPGIMILPRHRKLSWQVFKEIPAKISVDRIKKV
jgi:NADH-quinone oxidoreductase subunit G